MKWQPLQKLSTRAYFRLELNDALAALGHDVARLEAARGAIDADEEKAREAGQSIDTADRVQTLLLEEARVRKQYDALEDSVHTACLAAIATAEKELETAKATVIRRLVSIGYVDAPPERGVVGTILQEDVLRHPMAHEQIAIVAECQSATANRQAKQDNLTYLQILTKPAARALPPRTR